MNGLLTWRPVGWDDGEYFADNVPYINIILLYVSCVSEGATCRFLIYIFNKAFHFRRLLNIVS